MMKIRYNSVIVSVIMQLVSIAMYGQSEKRNYIVTETKLNESGAYVKSVQYYNGLGRPSVLATGGVNTCGKYVYSMTEYDKFGRNSKNWLPVIGGTDPDYVSVDDITEMSNTTYNDSRAYSITTYDLLDRPLVSTTPGNLWEGKSKNVEYITNKEKDVKRYTLTKAGLPTLPTDADKKFYEPCTLTGERTTDEDGHTLEVYKDILGNVVLERRNDGKNGNNDTYYVYDRGLLRAVVPPMGNSSSYSYRYKYDGHGRCIEKTLPQCLPIKYWYDKYGRLAFMQDGRMRSAKRYRFYLYDGLSRMVVQGMCTEGAGTIDSTYSANVVYGSGDKEIDNTLYFTSSNYILTSPSIEIVNYYDGYDCVNSKVFSGVKYRWGLTAGNGVCTTTLLTAQVVADNKGKRYYRTMYYDEKGRCVEANSTSIDDYFIKTNTSYSSTDKVTKTITKLHNKSLGSLCHTIVDSIEYDFVCNLPKKEYLTVDGNVTEVIAENVYDDLGRLVEKKSNNGNIRDLYAYNLHGWLTNHKNYDDRLYYMPMFKESLHYADGPNPTLCYNGNISAQVYSDAADTYNDKGYLFSYDDMDRLTKAKYMEGSDLTVKPRYDYSEEMTYNANSSITSLKRYGDEARYGYIDCLQYTYIGNQLARIIDTACNYNNRETFEFVDGYDYHTEYYYDGCGAMTSDYNKGVEKIQYDFNGMPTCVWFENGSITDYVYTADGVKLKTIHRTAVDGLNVNFNTLPELSEQNTLSKDFTLYVGAFEINNRLEKYYHDNMYVSFEDGRLQGYNYLVKDHLGNVRHVDMSDCLGGHSVTQIANYYPFGGIIDDYANKGMDGQNHLYNGKELDRMHGLNLYDYSSRQYDAALGQFTSMDPLCEKYYHISPYAYCAGNPIKYVDPTGMEMTDYGYNYSWSNDPWTGYSWNNAPLTYTWSNEPWSYSWYKDEKGIMADYSSESAEPADCYGFVEYCEETYDASMNIYGCVEKGLECFTNSKLYDVLSALGLCNGAVGVSLDGAMVGAYGYRIPECAYKGNHSTVLNGIGKYGRISSLGNGALSLAGVMDGNVTNSDVYSYLSTVCGFLGQATSECPPIALTFDIASLYFSVRSWQECKPGVYHTPVNTFGRIRHFEP